MKFMKSGSFVLVVILMVLFLFNVGSAKKDDVVTIKFANWVSLEEGTRNQIAKVIAQFEKENPQIKVAVQGIAVSDIEGQLAIMCSSGNAPDVAQETEGTVITHAISNFLEPVDRLASKEFLAEIPKSIYDAAGLYKGKHYCIPWAPCENGFWYNKKLMKEAGLDPEKPPQTLEELDKAVEQASARLPKEVIMLQLDTTIRTIGLYDQWPFMLAFCNGVPPVSSHGKVSFNSPGMKKYADWIRKQVKSGYTLPGKRFGEFRPYAANNRLLFGFDGPFLVGIMKSLNKSLTNQEIFDTWGIAATPAGTNSVHYTSGVCHSLVVFKASKHKKEAMKFIEYLVSSEYSIKNYLLSSGFPPLPKSAITKFPEIATNPIMKGFVEQVFPTDVPLPFGPNYAKTGEIIMSSVQEIITTDKPVAEILDKGQQKLVSLYKK